MWNNLTFLGKSTFFKQIRAIHTAKKDMTAESKKFVKVRSQSWKTKLTNFFRSCAKMQNFLCKGWSFRAKNAIFNSQKWLSNWTQQSLQKILRSGNFEFSFKKTLFFFRIFHQKQPRWFKLFGQMILSEKPMKKDMNLKFIFQQMPIIIFKIVPDFLNLITYPHLMIWWWQN